MTDTTILDGLMATLKRNPLTAPGPHDNLGVYREAVQTDVRPFYARREVVKATEANPNFSGVVDLFHDDVTAPRTERARQGSCPRVVQEFDGNRWVQLSACGGVVHAVETVVKGAVRVDGKCLKCGTEVHRAGLLNQKGT